MIRCHSAQESLRKPYVIAEREVFSQGSVQYPVTPMATNALEQNVHSTIVRRLQAAHQSTADLSAGLTRFLVGPAIHAATNPAESQRLTQRVLALMQNNVLVSDADMVKALGLVESTGDFVAEPDVEYFYVRSWAIHATDLARLLASWEEEGIEPREAWQWLYAIQIAETCFIRYVGKCRGPATPHKRYTTDLKQRESGLLHDFLEALQEIAPDSYASGKTFEFVEGRLGEIAEATIRDDRERAIIAFFDREKLLNRQHGGFYQSYIPSIDDYHLFKELNTDFIRRFRNACTSTHDDMLKAIDQWIEETKCYAEEHPIETKTGLHPLTQKYNTKRRHQLLPQMINDNVILLLIGKDVTFEEYIGSHTFLSGNSRAGYLTKDFLARLQAYERDASSWSTLDKLAFPFINLFPWMGHEDVTSALDYLSAFLRIVRPIITVTFSHLVTSSAHANFYHPYGLSQDNFLDSVGVLSLRHFEDRDWLSSVESEVTEWTIVIPHLDPGFDKYGAQPVELRAVIDLTWYLTFYVAHRAMKLLRAGKGAAKGKGPDRTTLVKRLYTECSEHDPMFMDPAVVALYERLKQAKTALKAHWEDVRQRRRRTVQPLDEEVRKVMSEKAVARILRGERARGAPNSDERKAQVNRLYKLHMPDTFLHVTDYKEDKDRWFQWAMTLPENMSFAMSSLAQAMPKAQRIRNSIRMFRPAEATDDSWMDDPTRMRKALLAKGAHLKQFLPADFYSSEKQRERVLRKTASDPLFAHTSVLQGREIKIWANGDMVLRWIAPAELLEALQTDRNVTLIVRGPKRAVPIQDGDKRFVQFLADGIGLYDENGRDIGPGALVRQQDFILHKSHRLLQALWASERAIIQGTAPIPALTIEAAAEGPVPVSVSVPARRPSLAQSISEALARGMETALSEPLEAEKMTSGRPPFKQQTSKKTMAAFGPVQANDGLWLLQQWLKETHPNGGTFSLADPIIFPNQQSMIPSFSMFLDKYPNHPYHKAWKNWLLPEELAGASRHIIANIRYLCPNTSSKRVQRKETQFQRLTVKPPIKE
ncbi:uncharacterized protein SPPG_03074 [Spizellomyces punctatus DAOM BR117]|uniref:Uncharacterized protein n=1 Tax=Spizellomyces punctatus (strain DAOM BR117) TaxID=645134 RepID=A0A0L0HJH2_SPIPD|nr:uncharacterized protein SPPG_03074 [Spizellomyces punctatus DAOM BR117]KND01262.1 hypothetical protein SPPG_03074 [Spizellomyces punctatus DAOM BR117]|eukprot:XP_016609301.1 hypothetical protein SPPG_03074 [Spizellomyces punctatus DAOM BR117]